MTNTRRKKGYKPASQRKTVQVRTHLTEKDAERLAFVALIDEISQPEAVRRAIAMYCDRKLQGEP